MDRKFKIIMLSVLGLGILSTGVLVLVTVYLFQHISIIEIISRLK